MINGTCDPAFAAVREAFETNFTEDEVGASVCLTVDGRTVVDLWGGHRDEARSQPWEADTLSVVFSNTKAAVALCAHVLIERGLLDPDARVTNYWPEFGMNGKEDTTVAMLLNHTSGLPALRDPLPEGAYADWDLMVTRLAAETPFWTPGTETGYQMISFGWLVGEVIRRVSGQSLGAFFAETVSGPLGLDYWIGLPPEMDARVAPLINVPRDKEPDSAFVRTWREDRESIPAKALLNSGRYYFNDIRYHRAEIGGAGGITNARSIAGMFTPLATGGMLGAERIRALQTQQSGGMPDRTLMIPTRFSAGMMLRMVAEPGPDDAYGSFPIGEAAFGHTGMGGSFGFADPDARIAMSYTMTQMGGLALLNPRGERLIKAAYDSL